MAEPASEQPALGGDNGLGMWMRSMTDSLRAINEEQELSQVLDLIAEQACNLLHLRQVAVYVLDHATDTFRIGGSHGLTDVYVANANAEPINLGEASAQHGPPTARAVLTRRAVIVGDAFEETGMERWRQNMQAEGLRTIVAAPLRGPDGNPMGTITGYAESPRAISEKHLDQITLLSDHAAAAIVAAHRRDSERAAIRALRDANKALQTQQRTVASLRDLQHELIQLVLQNAGLTRITDYLGERLNAQVYLDTESGAPLSDASRGSAREVPEAFKRLGELPKGHIREIIKSGRATHVTMSDWQSMALVPVPRTGQQQIRMWVHNQTDAVFDEDAQRAMESCALLIALERSRIEIQAHAEAKLVRDLLADLLSPAAMIYSETVMARAAALGHDPDSSHTPVVGVQVSGSPQAPAEDGVVAQLAMTLVSLLRGMRPRPVIGTVGGAIVALIPGPLNESTVKTLVEHARLPGRPQFRWIVGAPAPRLQDIPARLDITLRAGNLVSSDSPTVLYLEKMGVPGLLLEAGSSDRLLSLAKTTLGPVLQDEGAKNGDLLATLIEWFRCGLSTRETAGRLFVHPNTVSYRLRRIGDLTGLTLTNPADLMNVRLALDILQIQGLARGDLSLFPRPNH